MAENSDGAPGWWGEFTLGHGSARRWRIGALELSLERSQAEWLVKYRHSGARQPDDATWESDTRPLADDDGLTVQRHVLRGGDNVTLMPALADRPVVSRPNHTLFVHPAAQAVVYISSPVWMQLHMAGELLMELPIQRPSDTWFGADTRAGELCYATRTSARQSLADLPARPHRAITRLTVDNRSRDRLALEKISLPVPMLSLFSDAEGHLWTPPLTLTRQPDAEAVVIRVEELPPAEAVNAQALTTPRVSSERGALISAVEALFG